MKYYKFYLLSIGIILLDQIVKLWVHHSMQSIGTEIPVFDDWFKLHYTLNPGMAFGMELGGIYGKLILSIFRLFAMAGIAWYLYHLAKKNVSPGLLWCIALILGGAIGNVIDSTFYGVFLDNAPLDSPTPWFHGQVIDMFYIDICDCHIPDWVPFFKKGSSYPLWPIFNIADASIFTGVALILIMQKRYFKDRPSETPSKESLIEQKS